MTHAVLDDAFYDDPKIVEAIDAAGADAGWLWVCGLAHCAKHKTDGAISVAVSRRLHPTCKNRERTIKALVDAGLWVKTDDGFTMPKFLKWNPSKAQVEERIANAKARKDAWAERHKNASGTRSGTRSEHVNGTPPEDVGNASSRNAPAGVLLSSPLRSHTQAEPAVADPVGEARPYSPEAVDALAELERHAVLKPIANARTANALAGVAGTSKKSQDQVRKAIQDTARKATGHEYSALVLFELAKSCVQHARSTAAGAGPSGRAGGAWRPDHGPMSTLGDPTDEELAEAMRGGGDA